MSVEITDEAISESIRAFLATRDPSEVSLKEIRAHLEEKFTQNLDSKRGLIRSTVEDILLEGDADEEHVEAETGSNQENGDGTENEDEKQNGKKKKKGGGGFTKPLLLSEELANFMGTRCASRTEVTKQIWAYIKEKDLQNPKNKREVLLDERLQKLMKRKKVTMFSMTKILNPMMKSAADVTLSTLDTDDEEANDNNENGEDDDQSAMDVDEPLPQSYSSSKRGTKRQSTAITATEKENDDNENELPSISPTRTRYTAFTVAGSVKKDGTVTKPYVKQQVKVISSSAAEAKEEDDEDDRKPPQKKTAKVARTADNDDGNNDRPAKKSKPIGTTGNKKGVSSMYVQPELLDVLGVSKIKNRPTLVKKMWEYINKHKLQDDDDKRVILLDTKLKRVFGVDSFTCFSMNKYLSVLCKPLATSDNGTDNMEVSDANDENNNEGDD